MGLKRTRATAKGPADWFTGDVWIDTLGDGHGSGPISIGLIHFAPGARTAWHTHSVGQTLYVTEGEGRFQSRGEAVSTIRPGDVVTISGDEWHWHGAAADHFMTHLSVAEGYATWGDRVSDAEYGTPG
jgi:quercetin dioxygenase-like cupin family protein